MNGIELKIAYDGLHLTQQELAELWQINSSTIRRWERGLFAIPNKRAEQLAKYYAEIYNAFNGFCEFIEKQKLKKDDEVYLLAYNKDNYDGDFEHYKFHLKLLEECRYHLDGKVKVKIVEFDKPVYLKWLGNKKDTQTNRATWASLQE